MQPLFSPYYASLLKVESVMEWKSGRRFFSNSQLEAPFFSKTSNSFRLWENWNKGPFITLKWYVIGLWPIIFFTFTRQGEFHLVKYTRLIAPFQTTSFLCVSASLAMAKNYFLHAIQRHQFLIVLWYETTWGYLVFQRERERQRATIKNIPGDYHDILLTIKHFDIVFIAFLEQRTCQENRPLNAGFLNPILFLLFIYAVITKGTF